MFFFKVYLKKKVSTALKLQWLMEGAETKIQHIQRPKLSVVVYDWW